MYAIERHLEYTIKNGKDDKDGKKNIEKDTKDTFEIVEILFKAYQEAEGSIDKIISYRGRKLESILAIAAQSENPKLIEFLLKFPEIKETLLESQDED